MRLREKVVFITDADSSSGQTLINRLADEGAYFILNSASGGEAIQDHLRYCEAVCSKVISVNIDLCQAAEVSQVLEEAERVLGAIDVLIHNQNLFMPARVETCDEGLFVSIMNSNAKSAFICTQAVGKRMMTTQSGKIIYVSSIHAEKPTGSSFAYSVSKSALKMLAREAALELGRHGVNVNTIEMGPVEGDNKTFESDISDLYEDYGFKVPNAALGTYDDLADCVLFLSTGQSRYINGADIRLDGGFILHYMDHKMKKNILPTGG